MHHFVGLLVLPVAGEVVQGRAQGQGLAPERNGQQGLAAYEVKSVVSWLRQGDTMRVSSAFRCSVVIASKLRKREWKAADSTANNPFLATGLLLDGGLCDTEEGSLCARLAQVWRQRGLGREDQAQDGGQPWLVLERERGLGADKVLGHIKGLHVALDAAISIANALGIGRYYLDDKFIKSLSGFTGLNV